MNDRAALRDYGRMLAAQKRKPTFADWSDLAVAVGSVAALVAVLYFGG